MSRHRLLPVVLPLSLLAAAALTGAALLRQDLAGLDGYAGRTVLINEVCAKNLTGLTDGDGQTPDWIELLNTTGQDVDLSGWGLSDDPDDPYKWTFPEGTVLSGGANNILLLYADGADGLDADGALHTGFRLGRRGETLVLTTPEGTAADTLDFPAQEYDLSYGYLAGSGSEVGVLAAPTPGAVNSTAFLQPSDETADLPAVTFSAGAGFYQDALELTLSCTDAGAAIVYTLDGSLPTGSSTLYTGPITLTPRSGEANRYASLPTVLHGGWLANYAYSYAPEQVAKATTVTARAYKDGKLGEAVTVATYWVGIAPYSLPVVSVTADADDLFGAAGIYMPGQTYYTLHKYGDTSATGNYSGRETADVRVQILETDGTVQTAAEGTVRVSGGWSRSGVQLKNLHTKLKDGAQTDLLAAAPGGGTLSTVVLRGSGNGTAYQSLHQDAFLNNYLYDLDIGTQWNEPVILFLEDEYWGVYTVRESKNEDFYARHYGLEEDELICPGTSDEETAQPEKIAFGLGVDALDAATAEGMAWVEANVDVDEYIRYVIAQMYTYNSDGMYNGGNNSILWKSAVLDPDNPYADGRWRFLLNDLDSTLYDVEVDPFAYLLENDFSFAARETAPWYSVVDNLFQKLWQNADFRARFAEEFRREMATVYAPDSILPAFEAWVARLAPEIPQDLARQKVETTWLAPLARALGVEVEPGGITETEWDQNVEKVRDYFARRADIMLSYLDTYLKEADTI